MDFSEVVKNRYSCKKFSGKKVEKRSWIVFLRQDRQHLQPKNLQEQHIYVNTV